LADRKSWLALYLLCLGVLMIVLDTTVVTVALPSIQANLHFTAPSLIWVLNGYMLTFGGFLLLGGRLGDLYGQRRWFLIGLAAFTLASLACGLSQSRSALIVDSGLASGIVNTSFMMGGALGLAILASVADAQTDRSVSSGINAVNSLNAGYHMAFAGGAVLTALAGISGALLIRCKP
jgi:MFS family permease